MYQSLLLLNQRVIRFSFLGLCLITLLSACATQEEKDANRAERIRETERQLYETAERQIRSQQWESAIKNLQLLEENFPFGAYAEQAQLELIHAHYRNYDFDAAIANADRFIRLHPRHRNVDYAYYLKGLSSFSIGGGLFDRFAATDPSKRDVGAARESFAQFSQLLTLFPESQYVPDAEKRMIYLRNLLARYQIHVANYYFKRGAYIAAVGRGRYVLENFQQTPAVPDALAVLIQGYRLLEMEDLMNDSLMILKKNYPQHPSLKKNGEFDFKFSSLEDRSWFNKLTFGLFDKQDPGGFDSREIFDPQFQAN
ncbi:MAG: outer membrane protein assembly factor BamD [Cellvibrionaceae bacterium]